MDESSLQKETLKKIPEEYQFEYALAWKKIMEIRNGLKDFIPETKEEHDRVNKDLIEYRKLFLQIAGLNGKIKRDY